MVTSAAPAYVVDATVTHRRRHPVDHAFEHRTTTWLVDAAEPDASFPRWLRRLMTIRSRDHLQPGDAPLLDKVRVTVAEHGLAWSAARVQVLTGARTAGHVFDPLTTYFCFDPDGRLEGVLAEVHNTYGGRHVYPLAAERDSVDKAFYVSPFFAVEGRYDIRARLTTSYVSVAITLTQHDVRVFTGSVHGALRPATRRTVLRTWLRDPLASQRVSALIRWHGIRLWLRRLPVVPRTTAPTRGGTA